MTNMRYRQFVTACWEKRESRHESYRPDLYSYGLYSYGPV